MATVEVVNAERTLAIEASNVVDGEIDESGHLILKRFDGQEIDAGSVTGDFSLATTEIAGVVELATDAETIAGTDSAKVVTPLSLAALTATDARKGLVEIATEVEAFTGTDPLRVISVAVLAAVMDEAYSSLQPQDNDLTAIAALSPGNDSIIQRKAGSWSSRTMAQLATDLSATGEFPDIMLHNGSAYADADSTKIYVGPSDPGSVSNGCIWFDTTGA